MCACWPRMCRDRPVRPATAAAPDLQTTLSLFLPAASDWPPSLAITRYFVRVQNKVPLLPIVGAPATLVARTMQELLVHGPLTTAQLARRLHSSRGAVGEVVKDLDRAGLVTELGLQQTTGRPGILQGIPAELGWVIGIDLGATNVRVAVSNVRGELVGEIRRLTPRTNVESLLNEIDLMIQQLAEVTGTKVDPILAVCVGVPGSLNSKRGSINNADNLPIINGTRFLDELKKRWAVTILVDNDVTLAALGEWVSRNGTQSDHYQGNDLAFLSLGTGMGMGFVVDGAPWRGANGAAGEIGLIPRGLSQTNSLEELFADPTVDPDHTTDIVLVHALEIVSRILDPSMIVVGGGRIHSPDIVDEARVSLATRVSPLPLIEASQLGDQAGLVGALSTAIESAHRAIIGRVCT